MKTFEFTTPTPTSIRIVRTFDAPVKLVWRAHTEPELVKQWMTGPPDHSLPVCEIDFRVGGKARYVWKNPQFEMGMTAEFKEIVEHERIVHTEVFDGWPEGSTTVTTTFVESKGRTTATVEIEYQSQEVRDQAMQPGFKEGFEASYETLDKLLPNLSDE
ncbi:MAG: SRPBCC family protein [Phycisphaerales bacterium]|nr:SRPBCC family protein [Phycisphaerales bacterium]